MICLQMGKTSKAKTLPGDFKVTTLENPLLSQQVVTSRGISVPYTNLQLNPYPNTQLDLFYSDNLSFQCTTPNLWLTNWCMDPSKWLTTNLGKMLAAKFFSSSTRWRLRSSSVTKTLRHTNAADSSRERWTRINCLWSQYACEKFLHWVASSVTALKIILIYV